MISSIHISLNQSPLWLSRSSRAMRGQRLLFTKFSNSKTKWMTLRAMIFSSNQVTKLSLPNITTIRGAANGLLLLQPAGSGVDDVVYIVNPVTREYVVVAGPNGEPISKKHRFWAYGFGASRISRQHKVVRINNKSECYVYTLETESWRRVAVEAAHASLCCIRICFSAFVGGNLYCTVSFSASPILVACFDLEMECFSSFDAPTSCGNLSVLKDCLCFCECEDENDEIVLWLMKNKSWSKEYMIKKPICGESYYYYCACPINVFRNGDTLMLCDDEFILFYNSNETKAIQEIAGILGPHESIYSKLHASALYVIAVAVDGCSFVDRLREERRLISTGLLQHFVACLWEEQQSGKFVLVKLLG